MAVTVEFGKCAKCNDNNSKAAKQCRSCGATLPWVEKSAPAKRRTPAHSPGPSYWSRIDWNAFGIAAISFFVPPIGYLLCRSYSRNGDDGKAGVALVATVLGILFHVGRYALRFVT